MSERRGAWHESSPDVVWLKLQPGSLILPGSLLPLWLNVRERDNERASDSAKVARNVQTFGARSRLCSALPFRLVCFCLCLLSGLSFAAAVCSDVIRFLPRLSVTEMKDCCILICVRCGQAYVTLQVGSPVLLFLLPALLGVHSLLFFTNVRSPTGCDCYNNIHGALLECQPDLSASVGDYPRFPANCYSVLTSLPMLHLCLQ